MDFKEVLNILYDTLVFLWLSVVYITESFVLSLIPRKYRSKSIQGEVALVTGGAGGLGKLIALKLAALGTHVVIWDINKSGIKDVVDEIKSQGGKCTGYFCDISNKEEIYRVAKTVQVEVGNITIIVNNAGYVCGKTFMNLPDDEIEKTFKVNILSHYWVNKSIRLFKYLFTNSFLLNFYNKIFNNLQINKSFMKEMMKENHGHIVTIASVAGLLGTYNCTDYSATKFAAIGYHESLLTELKVHGYHGINTTLVCPYFINTGMFPGVKPRLLPMLEPEYVADEVVAGILTNQINVTMPISTKYFLPLKSWLPPKLCWALMYNIIKGPQTMMMLQKNENMHNYDRINKY
ncbi:short-chain dehydrogenase/reductase family 16C member 6-like isoform X1 [Microplitis mediator]|uniref:short-chain dehydrogenase/reductase family 16C member 6-like isoform X1 n=1 Tax=Microplitis mediator TaxID=375433 RepID=UPI002557BCC9|nr:short-chain dehydrogenase/reductase family 16C member 6-like isoform X1 [Microplitis mediator]